MAAPATRPGYLAAVEGAFAQIPPSRTSPSAGVLRRSLDDAYVELSFAFVRLQGSSRLRGRLE